MLCDAELSNKYVIDGNLQLYQMKKDFAEVEVILASISAKRSVYVVRVREDLVSDSSFVALVG